MIKNDLLKLLATFYYKEMRPLEQEYDALMDKYQALKETSITMNNEYKKAKKSIRELKEKINYLESVKMTDDNIKYRDIAKELGRKLGESEKLVSRQKQEIERKDKQIEAYKSTLLKRGEINGEIQN